MHYLFTGHIDGGRMLRETVDGVFKKLGDNVGYGPPRLHDGKRQPIGRFSCMRGPRAAQARLNVPEWLGWESTVGGPARDFIHLVPGEEFAQRLAQYSARLSLLMLPRWPEGSRPAGLAD